MNEDDVQLLLRPDNYPCSCSDCARAEQEKKDFETYLKGFGPNDFMQISPPPCECGKEKHGFASHLTWCPMG